MAYNYGLRSNIADDYENFDEYGNPISTGGFTPQVGNFASDMGGYERTPAPANTGLNVASAVVGEVNPALGIGLKGLSAVASYFGGAQARGIRKQGIQGLRGMIGRPVYDPNQAFSFARRATYNDAQQMGGQYDRNFGLDTGRGAGMYGKAIVDRLASQSSGLYVDSEKAKADRDARIYQLLASYQG